MPTRNCAIVCSSFSFLFLALVLRIDSKDPSPMTAGRREALDEEMGVVVKDADDSLNFGFKGVISSYVSERGDIGGFRKADFDCTDVRSGDWAAVVIVGSFM